MLNLELSKFHFILRPVFTINPTGIYLLKVNDRNTRTRCEICLKLAIKTPERRQWYRSGVFIVNFEHISHLTLVFLLLTLNISGWEYPFSQYQVLCIYDKSCITCMCIPVSKRNSIPTWKKVSFHNLGRVQADWAERQQQISVYQMKKRSSHVGKECLGSTNWPANSCILLLFPL